MAQSLRASGMVSVGSPWRVVRTLLRVTVMSESAADDVVRVLAVVLMVGLAAALLRPIKAPADAWAWAPFALVLAWLVAWPYVLPWYDALGWALLPHPPGDLVRLAAARADRGARVRVPAGPFDGDHDPWRTALGGARGEVGGDPRGAGSGDVVAGDRGTAAGGASTTVLAGAAVADLAASGPGRCEPGVTGIVLNVKAIAFASAVGAFCGVVGVILALLAQRRAARAVRQCNDLIQGAIGSRGTVDPRALRDVAIVRYDALNEMSGQLSFSVALLNSSGDGVVLSSINGRADTRTYAKPVLAGQGTEELARGGAGGSYGPAGCGAARGRARAIGATQQRVAPHPRYGMMRLCAMPTWGRRERLQKRPWRA